MFSVDMQTRGDRSLNFLLRLHS